MHENIPFEDKIASVKVDFLWHPEVNGSMKQCIKVWTEAMIHVNTFSQVADFLERKFGNPTVV